MMTNTIKNTKAREARLIKFACTAVVLVSIIMSINGEHTLLFAMVTAGGLTFLAKTLNTYTGLRSGLKFIVLYALFLGCIGVYYLLEKYLI